MSKMKKIAMIAIIAMALSMTPVSLFAAAEDSDRLAGDDRIGTALAIAEEGWDTAEAVVLAPADEDNLVDALAAAPLAGQEDAPILLTSKNSLNEAVKTKISELGAATVYVIGAVSDNVMAEVEAIDGVIAKKLAGADRWTTADAINAELADPAGTFIVGYNALADALSVASYAAANGFAIVLTAPDGTVDELKLVGEKTYLVGGEAVVKDHANANGRFGGADRFETNQAVAEGLDFSYDRIFAANGLSMVDALAAAPLAAHDGAFVLLVDEGKVTAPDGIMGSSAVIAVGGRAVVSAGIIDEVRAAAKAAGEDKEDNEENLEDDSAIPDSEGKEQKGDDDDDAADVRAVYSKNNDETTVTIQFTENLMADALTASMIKVNDGDYKVIGLVNDKDGRDGQLQFRVEGELFKGDKIAISIIHDTAGNYTTNLVLKIEEKGTAERR